MMLSFVTPTYNRSRLLPRMIESVLRQQRTDFEIVIVDDASTDDTPAVVRQIGDGRVRYFRQERNTGPCMARNSGVILARGQYCVMLDDDDELSPQGGEAITAAIAQSGRAGLIFGNARVAETGQLTASLPFAEGQVRLPDYLAERVGGELVPVVRRDIAARMPYPDTGASGEGLLWTRMVREVGAWATSQVFVVRHIDAHARLTDASVQLARAEQNAAIQRTFLDEFGQELRQHAPRVYRRRLAAAMVYSVVARRPGRARELWTQFADARSVYSLAAWLLSFMPPPAAKKLFAWYRGVTRRVI